MAIPWITTSLASGPIPANNYDCTICGLSGNSIYEYRAYMVVGGISYYGDTLRTNTCEILPYPPIVTTGNAHTIGSISLEISGNTVNDKGAVTPINEYGVLYTQDSLVGLESNLRYGCVGAYSHSISSDIAINDPYFTGSTGLIAGLNPNSTTYYRAFAKNNGLIGYGIIKTDQTEPSPPPSQRYVYLIGNYLELNDGYVCGCAKINVEPPLEAGQCFELCYSDYSCVYATSMKNLMWSCSYLYHPSINETCSTAYSPNGTVPNQSCELSGSVIINCDNINNYTFFTESCSHPANYSPTPLNYKNCATIILGAVANQVGNGGIPWVAEENSTYSVCMTVHTLSSTCSAGGYMPEIR